MRVLADQNVSRKVVERLRASGVDIVRVEDALHPRALDTEILAEAERLGALVLSHDQDFSNLLANFRSASRSLLNLRVSFVDVERLSHVILDVLAATKDDLEAGAVVTVDDNHVRIRRLPIG